jgi:hypothetical protein
MTLDDHHAHIPTTSHIITQMKTIYTPETLKPESTSQIAFTFPNHFCHISSSAKNTFQT